MGRVMGCRLARQGGVWLFALALAGCGGGGGGSGGGAQPPAQVPLVTAQSFSLTEDTAFTATIQSSPTGGATFSVQQTTQPQKGTITAFGSNGSFTYQPNANVFGQDTFSISATDSAGKTGSAVVTLNIAGVNDVPAAANDRLVVASAGTVTIDVLTNDSDVEGEALNVELLTPGQGETPNPEVGTAVVNSSNQIVVSLPTDFRGVTRVRYRAKDSSGGSSEIATVVAFVGTEAFETWYALDGVVYASDLFASREVTAFTAPGRPGNLKFSGNKEVAVIEEVTNNRITALHTVSTQEIEATEIVTAPLAADETVFAYETNHDGSWVAYVIEKTNGTRTLWLAPRAAPADRQAVALPGTYEYTEAEGRISPMTFNAAGNALYFVAENDLSAQRLYRVAVATPTQPEAMIADADPSFISQVGTFFVAPTETHLVADMYVTGHSGLYRVSLPDTTQRTLLSPNEGITSIVGDAELTRVAYTTLGASIPDFTDDRVMMADVSTTPNIRQVVAANASRTEFLLPLQIRPDGDALLLEDSSTVGTSTQVDIAEALVGGSLTVVSEPAVNDTSISQYATYDPSGDSIIYLWVENGAPWRLIEIKRGAFDQPIDLVPPGSVYGPVYSSDMATLAVTHQESGSSLGSRVRIVNRSAPGSLIDVTSGQPVPTEIALFGLVETE